MDFRRQRNCINFCIKQIKVAQPFLRSQTQNGTLQSINVIGSICCCCCRRKSFHLCVYNVVSLYPKCSSNIKQLQLANIPVLFDDKKLLLLLLQFQFLWAEIFSQTKLWTITTTKMTPIGVENSNRKKRMEKTVIIRDHIISYI